MPDPLWLRGERPPALLVLLRLGRNTLTDDKLRDSCDDAFRRWGLFGFSAFGLGPGGYAELARQVPLLPTRQWVMEAASSDLLDDGFPVLPTGDQPHWTVVLAAPEPTHFERVRRHFSDPIRNPIWPGRR